MIQEAEAVVPEEIVQEEEALVLEAEVVAGS